LQLNIGEHFAWKICCFYDILPYLNSALRILLEKMIEVWKNNGGLIGLVEEN